MAGPDATPAGREPTAGELPTGELPTGELPTGELPTGELPTGELPTGELPTGELPAEEPPAGGLPGRGLAAGAPPAEGPLAGRPPAGGVTAAELLDAAVGDGVVPGAVLAAGLRGGEPMLLHVCGDAQRDAAARRPMTVDTVFDLASLTKVVATLPCVLHLVASGGVGLDDPVTRYLPAFSGPGKDRVTVRHLLTHTSGLPSERPFHRYLRGRGAILAAALAEPLVSEPGRAFCYSDIGFIAAGELAAAVAGCGLAELTREVVCEPLGMAARYLPPRDWAARIAATEIVAGAAKVGVVHDENAEAMGGVAGHAGMFGTAADLGRYAAMWVSAALRAGPSSAVGSAAEPARESDPRESAARVPGRCESADRISGAEGADGVIPGWLRAGALRCQTGGLAGRRGLGWGLRGDPWDNMGEGWPSSGAGHTGFTGTSLSIDPVTGLWAVLLTNAVHFGRDRKHSAVTLRGQVHAAVAAQLLRPARAAGS